MSKIITEAVAATSATAATDTVAAASKFPSITAANKYGISRSLLTYMLHNQFYFDKKYIDCLYSYYIHQWECKHFCKKLQDGRIYHKNRWFQVIYHKTDPTAIKRAALTQPRTSHVKLSFRVAEAEFSIYPVVLIRLYTNTEGKLR